MANRKKDSVARLRKRHQALARKLSATGLVLQGTITERVLTDPRGTAKTFGPYYQWTFKREGKTVTVNLTKDQVGIFQAAIDNNRKLKEIIEEMRKISLDICNATTQGVIKRKPKNPS